jgi:hypothetical protein
VKKFLQISNVLLVKIQNESNMIKWAHLAHDAHGGYSLPPLEQPTETDAVVQKLSSLEQNSDEQR